MNTIDLRSQITDSAVNSPSRTAAVRWHAVVAICSSWVSAPVILLFHLSGSGFAWTGLGSVVEGNRQLEMGANVECEELGCVVGGPFKPNKFREVWGLVWRPWINKPSEMTMRCADICRHTALSYKHTQREPFLLCPVSHMTHPPPSLPHLSHFIPLLILLTPSPYFICYSPPPPSTIPPFHISPVIPSIRSSMHAWLAVQGSAYAIGSTTEPLWQSAVAQQPVFRPTKFIYREEAVRLLTTAFLFSPGLKEEV